MATLLEVSIMRLTRESPSGGICRIGDAAFTVRYCSDIWEWEYLNETFWDVQDLAQAIERQRLAAAGAEARASGLPARGFKVTASRTARFGI